ncbi:hypothetical protein [Streptomyces sp. V3I7]|uniref:hypothetical protein n=1 Tax=Streptomyces sp. V3I7 TaxID=3042278 RepID=UPI00278A7DBB|nr:hypothetical protein [Streptomyces sp. V3I7]MDQ0994815.1 hypothetical protein [Streptomyces sp. V3I7]
MTPEQRVEDSAPDQFATFAEDVARELGTHCRTAPMDGYGRRPARLIIDSDGRALRVFADRRKPGRLEICAALPDDADVRTPSIGVSAISARHVAREIVRRLYPLHAQAVELAAHIAATRQEEARRRGAVAEAVGVRVALPGTEVLAETAGRTVLVWSALSVEGGTAPPCEVRVNIGRSGERVEAEICGSPGPIAAMLGRLVEACSG